MRASGVPITGVGTRIAPIRTSMPRSSAHRWVVRASCGVDEARTTTTLPPNTSPGSEPSTSRVASWSRKHVMTRRALLTADARSSATVAPASAIRSDADRVRFHTVVGTSAVRNACASADPIGPRPIIVTPALRCAASFCVIGLSSTEQLTATSTHYFVAYLPGGGCGVHLPDERCIPWRAFSADSTPPSRW
ncbi:Uncharacterised protein [Mycobacteroides abscessus subsp. abscessus]|nr:Uncharacterised protein [Mycobacteroides abscessus subsp. abscessus]